MPDETSSENTENNPDADAAKEAVENRTERSTGHLKGSMGGKRTNGDAGKKGGT